MNLTLQYTALDAAYVAALVRGDPEQADLLEHALDDTPGDHEHIPLLTAALWYAEQDWAVFPCMPGEKKPFPGSHGLHDATTDPIQIQQWWNATPGANIGFRTGLHFDVIDIDGDQGHQSFADMVADGDCPLIAAVSLTPRGMHLWRTATGRPNKAGMRAGVDYRGDGGYVIVPPSRTPAGIYTWRKIPPTQGQR